MTYQNPWRAAALAIALAGLAACGGGGGDSGGAATTAPPAVQIEPGTASTVYERSVVLGLEAPQSLVWHDPPAGFAPTLTAPAAGDYLEAGTNYVVAEFRPQALPGVRMACVSGRGESIGTFTRINLGVLAVSAAVLLDARWQPVDTEAAWAAAQQQTWTGWENCGAKLEGPLSASTRLMPRPDGGYEEDIYDGNPSTNFNILRWSVPAAAARAMRSPAGWATTDDPARPLVLTWRAWRNDLGQVLFVLRGDPQSGAPPGTRGFIALYVPAA